MVLAQIWGMKGDWCLHFFTCGLQKFCRFCYCILLLVCRNFVTLRDEGGLVFTFCYLWCAEILWILLLLVCQSFVTLREGGDWCSDLIWYDLQSHKQIHTLTKKNSIAHYVHFLYYHIIPQILGWKKLHGAIGICGHFPLVPYSKMIWMLSRCQKCLSDALKGIL